MSYKTKILYSLLICATFTLICLFGANLFTKTTYGKELIKRAVKAELLRFGLNSKFDDFSLSFFTQLEVNNLEINTAKQAKTSGNKVKLKIKKIIIQYSLLDSIYQRQAVVDSIKIDNVQIKTSIFAKTKKELDAKIYDFNQKIDDLFKKNKYFISLDLISIKNAKIELVFVKDNNKIKISAHPKTLSLYAKYYKNKIELKQEVKMDDFNGNLVEITSRNKGAVFTGKFHFKLNSSMFFHLTDKNQGWHIDIKDFADNIDLRDIKLNFKLQEKQLSSTIDRLNHASKLNASSYKDDNSKNHPKASFFPLKVFSKQELSLANLKAKYSDKKDLYNLNYKSLKLNTNIYGDFKTYKDFIKNAELNITTIIKNKGLIAKSNDGLNIKTEDQTIKLVNNFIDSKTDFDLQASLDSFKITQIKQPTPISFSLSGKKINFFDVINSKKTLNLKTSININNFYHSKIKKPCKLDLNSEINANFANKTFVSNGQIKLNDEHLSTFNLNLKDFKKETALNSNISFVLRKKLKNTIPTVDFLNKTGSLSLTNNIALKIKHPFNSIIEFKGDTKKITAAEAKATTSIKQIAPTSQQHQLKLRLAQPINIKNSINWKANKATHRLKVKAPSLSLDNELHSKGLVLNATTNIDSQSSIEKIDTNIKIKIRELKKTSFSKSKTQLPQINNISFNILGEIKNRERFIVKDLSLKTKDNLFASKSISSGEISKKDLISSGNLHLNFNKFKHAIFDNKATGVVLFDWDLTVLNMKKLALIAKLDLKDINITNKNFSFESLNGQLRILEEITINKENKIAFLYPAPNDPFQRVNYQKVGGYLKELDDIFIKSIHYKDLILGPLKTRVVINQNIVLIPKLELKLLGGVLNGQFKLNLSPQNKTLNIKGNLTRINIDKLLKNKTPLSQDLKNGYLDANAALEFNLSTSLVSGQINITHIDDHQLLRILNIIDPDYTNEKIGKLRTALDYGYPQFVKLEFINGLMNINVKIKSVKDSTVNLNHLEITKLIKPYIQDLRELIDQLPIN